jgi:hypothetical protein
MLPKLKRTVAVTCLLATACFVILWMRSLKQWDNILYASPAVGLFEVSSNDGRLALGYGHSDEFAYSDSQTLFWLSQPRTNSLAVPLFPALRLTSDQVSRSIFLPFWLLISVSSLVGFFLIVARPFRFSLRALAIAATLIVLTLGLGVAASRLTLG